MVARYFGLIPAAGKGERFGAALPKQYQGLRGRTVLNHSVDALLVNTPLARVYVVHADRDQRCAEIVGSGYRIATLACGGATRAKSVHNALAVLLRQRGAEALTLARGGNQSEIASRHRVRMRGSEHDD